MNHIRFFTNIVQESHEPRSPRPLRDRSAGNPGPGKD